MQYTAVATPNVLGPAQDVMGVYFTSPGEDAVGVWPLPIDGCDDCVVLAVNNGEGTVYHHATAGTLQVDAGSEVYGGKISGRLLDVTFREVDLDNYLVPNGQCRHLQEAEISVGSLDEWSCNGMYYGSGDGCDCGCGTLDPDCANALSSACEYCEPASCANDGTDFGCDIELLQETDNTTCDGCSCAGKECGDDGCGGSCGSCVGNETFNAQGQCTCVPDCSGAECGPNGCGGTCGSCAGNESCVGGTCECQPTACGGACGACAAPAVCNNGQCCSPNCAGKSCGSDGCGGSCGTCPGAGVCTAQFTCCNAAAQCFNDAACCGGVCNIITDSCQACHPLGYPFCGSHAECCSGLCDDTTCTNCLDSFSPCTSGAQCCSGVCSPNGSCAP